LYNNPLDSAVDSFPFPGVVPLTVYKVPVALDVLLATPTNKELLSAPRVSVTFVPPTAGCESETTFTLIVEGSHPFSGASAEIAVVLFLVLSEIV
jgi:hypothetical protein